MNLINLKNQCGFLEIGPSNEAFTWSNNQQLEVAFGKEFIMYLLIRYGFSLIFLQMFQFLKE